MKKFYKKIILFLILFLICYLLGFLLNCFISNKYIFNLDIVLLFNGKTLLYGTFLFAIFVCIYLYNFDKTYWRKNGKKIISGDKKDNDIETNFEQAHFQTDKEIELNFKKINYNDLDKTNVNGIPIKAEYKNKDLDIYFTKPAHTLVIGTTGSGKTTTFVNPTIQILSKTKDKPSMLISDPKGELFSLHSSALEKRGYEVKILDLRNPYNSVKWNPLETIYVQYQRAMNIEKELKVNDNGTYEFNGVLYDNENNVRIEMEVVRQKILDDIYEDLHDIVSLICPVVNKKEPLWENGSKNFVLAIALAMLEDSQNKDLGMTIDKFNFYNIMKIASNTENNCDELKRYFKNRSPISQSVSLSKQVMDAASQTRDSYLSNVFDKLSMFSDRSICSLTSSNEIAFGEMGERPIALFLQIPDEKETRYTLASMAILQAYKELVAKANTYKDLCLPRSVYFILDEFGNLPRINKLEQMITVGRSRHIWLSLVVQSYSQLSKIYDDKSADIIKANCNIQIFIGTTDLKTINDFSKLCGNYAVISRNISFSQAKAEDFNTTMSVKERPLIYPTELQQLNSDKNMGNAIVNIFGYAPIKSKFTPSFQCELYDLGKSTQKLGVAHYFDEEGTLYNMKHRNELLVPKEEKVYSKMIKTVNEQKVNETKTESNNVKDMLIKRLNRLSQKIITAEDIKQILSKFDDEDINFVIAELISLRNKANIEKLVDDEIEISALLLLMDKITKEQNKIL